MNLYWRLDLIRIRFSCLGSCLLAGFGASLAQDNPATSQPGANPPAAAVKVRTSAVTVYQGTALVTRRVTVAPGSAGLVDIVVPELPTAVQCDSVYADHPDNVSIRSISCRVRPPDDLAASKSKAATLDQDIRNLRRKMTESRNEISLRRIRQQYLRSLENFVAPAATQEMTKGVLQAEELEKVTKMHFNEYEKASQEIMKFDLELQDDEDKLGRLESERKRLVAGPPQTYDAIVSVERRDNAPCAFDLNYLVGDCSWTPNYNIHGDAAKNEAEIEFNALVQQVSGENWDGVTMTLSTASPSVSACNPSLTPLYVSMSPMDSRPQSSPDSYYKALAGREQAVKGQMRGTSAGEIADAIFEANVSAASVQLIELSERLSELRRAGNGESSTDASTQQFKLTLPVTVNSLREAQLVPVLRHKDKAVFRHVAVPVLTSAVFREGELANSTGRDLPGGRVNVYLDGEFTGRTDLGPISRGRPVVLGFGVDGQLRARRSILSRDEQIQGGNRLVSVSTEVVIDNYKDKPASVRVRERVPWLEDASRLRLSLGQLSQPLSEEADYQRFEKPKGILMWDVSVTPGNGAGVTSLRYTYSLEFEKSMMLHDIGSDQKIRLKKEFVEQQTKPVAKGELEKESK